MFLHDIILKALNCIPVKDAKEKVAELAKVDPETSKTAYNTQVEVCGSSCIHKYNMYPHLPASVIIVELIQIQS